MIVAFRAPESLAASKELPKRLTLAKWGRNESVKGPVIVNETTVRALPRLQALAGFDEVAFDFQHNTVPGSEAFKAEQEPRKVAAFGVPEVVPGEGLFLNVKRWTPEGEDAVKNGHYPDVSPAVKFEGDAESGVVIFCHSAAACRQGAITDLHVFSAEESPKIKSAFATFAAETGAAAAKTFTAMDYKKLLCTILGCAETSDDAQIADAAKTFSAKLSQVNEFAAKLGDIGKKVASLETAAGTTERQALIETAIRAGKIVPFGAEVDKLSNAQLKGVLDALPADQVPLAKRTIDNVKTFSASGVQKPADDLAEKMRQAGGIKKEDWDKHAV